MAESVETSLVERALAALDDALIDAIKSEFDSGLRVWYLSGLDEGKAADPAALASAADRFEIALAQLKVTHAAAKPIIEKIFGKAGQ